MTNCTISEELEKIAKAVISEHEDLKCLSDGKCRVIYQYSDAKKTSRGKTVFADTELIKEKIKSFVSYDFVVTFYKQATSNLTDESLKKLMYHELKHIGFSEDGKCTIVPHDIEDFRDVVDKWGIDWIN